LALSETESKIINYDFVAGFEDLKDSLADDEVSSFAGKISELDNNESKVRALVPLISRLNGTEKDCLISTVFQSISELEESWWFLYPLQHRACYQVS